MRLRAFSPYFSSWDVIFLVCDDELAFFRCFSQQTAVYRTKVVVANPLANFVLPFCSTLLRRFKGLRVHIELRMVILNVPGLEF